MNTRNKQIIEQLSESERIVAWENAKAALPSFSPEMDQPGSPIKPRILAHLSGISNRKLYKIGSLSSSKLMHFKHQALKMWLQTSDLNSQSVLTVSANPGCENSGFVVIAEAFDANFRRIPDYQADSFKSVIPGAVYSEFTTLSPISIPLSVFGNQADCFVVLTLLNVSKDADLFSKIDRQMPPNRRTPYEPEKQDLLYRERKAVSPQKAYALSGVFSGTTDDVSRAAVVLFRFFREDFSELASELDGFSHSRSYPNYKYVSITERPVDSLLFLFTTPEDAVHCEISLKAWNLGVIHEQSLHPIIEFDTETLRQLTYLPLHAAGVLEDIDNYLLRSGEISARASMLKTLAEQTEDKKWASRLAGVNDRLLELNTKWIPYIPPLRAANGETRDHRSLRIAHLHKISYPYENSGGAIRNLNIAIAQKARGLDPYVVTPYGYPENSRSQQESVRGIQHYRIAPAAPNGPTLLTQQLSFDSYLTALILLTKGVDVIHASSGIRGYELALKGLALRKALRNPLVYEVRSFHEHTWGGEQTKAFSAEMTRLRMRQEERCMSEADAVVTISEAMRTELIERGVSDDKLFVVPNAVDNRFLAEQTAPLSQRSVLGIPEDSPTVGYVSNMSWREGHDILLHAFSKLLITQPKASCLLVGEGPSRASLEALSVKLGIAESVYFTGEVDHSTIVSYYQTIDIFVVPRRADYAADFVTPLKPYEVMAIGRPLIVADRPSLKEIVGDSERGLFFETENVDSLCNSISDVIQQPEQALARAKTAKKWIREERTWESVAAQYNEIYQFAVNRFKQTQSRTQ